MDILHSKPTLTDADLETMNSIVRSQMIAQGEMCGKVERRFSSWMHSTGGVAVGSGSAAIQLALLGLEIEPGDEVVLPTYVCASVFEAVLSVGALPVLCDIGPDWVVTVGDVEPKITSETRAIIVPHTYGVFADVQSFRVFGLPLIEDCAQAVDAEGSRRLGGDVAVISFHPTKCLTSGEGGVAVTANDEILDKMRKRRDGDQQRLVRRLFSPFSDIAASLLWEQANRYGAMLRRRGAIAERYLSVIKTVSPGALNLNALGNSMYFRFPIRLPGGVPLYQQRFLSYGIHVRVGIGRLLHRIVGLDDSLFPVATELFNTTVSLPIYPALSADEENRCVEAIRAILSREEL